jgi:hypothetical protein
MKARLTKAEVLRRADEAIGGIMVDELTKHRDLMSDNGFSNREIDAVTARYATELAAMRATWLAEIARFCDEPNAPSWRVQ